MTRFLSSCFLMAFIACAGFTRAGDEGPSKKIPELKVLDHYLGTWETETPVDVWGDGPVDHRLQWH